MAGQGKRVAVVSPEGQFGTVDEADVENLPEGARVLTKQQLAERAVQERYDALPAASKALGVVNSVAGLAAGPLAFGADPNAPPTIAAAGAGIRHGLTGGLYDAGVRKLADAVGGKEAGDRFAAQRDQEVEASPTATSVGSVIGMAGGAAIGGAGAGAARALPSAALSSAGNVLEHGVARALGGLATRGALGKAAATGASMAVRGAVEGAAYAGVEQGASDVLHDTPTTGEKLYGAMGHGALYGGALGGALGFGGSLAGSGARGLASRVGSRLEEGAERAAIAEAPMLGEGAAEAAPRMREMPRLTTEELDAGLKGGASKAESPFSIGGERRPVQLRPGGRTRPVPTDEPISLRKGEPVTLDELFTSAGDRPPSVTIDPEAGIAKRGSSGKFQGKVETEDALRLSSAKKVPHGIDVNLGSELGAVEAKSPIKIPGGEPVAAAPKPKGIMGMLSDPNNAARAMAQEQAWKAVGAGFGLQSTRYAKEAAKYFGGTDGTRALGEVALRHGLVDLGDASASPLQAAWRAAKSGTAADIVPKAQAALDTVGSQIGEITQASGARVKLADVDHALAKVRSSYDKYAGNEHVVGAVDSYGASLKSKLGGGADVSIQELLEQRKGLDRIVYEETKTLDPGRRVAALREVRSELEGLITSALDEASGQVPGALKDRYATLKRDYHALRILGDAAEDSAARSSKAATFGLGEKMAIANSVAGGHLTAAPVLAAGGKIIRERGNAAAAAFLSRAADQGTFAEIVRKFDMRVSKAAAGVLREAPTVEGKASSRSSAAVNQRTPTAEEGRAETAAVRKQGAEVVKWVGEMRANPARLMQQLEDAAELVGQSAGPKAAESYTGATLRAIGFIAGHIPIKERRDPLDPRSTPPLSYDEASRLVRAAKYATKPETVFDDFERGIITPEGLRAAKTFAPESFAEFQAQLQGHVENHMLRNKQLTQSQRLRIDKLLGYPAGADLKPAAIARLQANLMKAPDGAPPADPTGGGGAPPPPVNMTVQQTGFDAVEARQAS